MVSAKKYLITGGTGFIGSALVRRLVADGHSVRVLDDDSRGAAKRLTDMRESFELISGNIRSLEQTRQAVRGVDAVCHLAYVNGTEYFYARPELVLEVAVKGIVNALDACAAEGVSEFVLASSSEVYQTPPVVPTGEDAPLSVPDALNPRYSYGGGKIISELMLLHYARKFIDRALIFRPHNAYGPDMGCEHVIPQFILRMKALVAAAEANDGALDFPIQGSGKETRAFVYISDLIDGIVRVMEKGEHRGIYHVGTDVETPIAALAHEVAQLFGRAIHLVPGKLPPGGTPRRCPDIGRLRALGYEPRVTLAEGLAKTAEWYRAN